jgi:hypothetical protein
MSELDTAEREHPGCVLNPRCRRPDCASRCMAGSRRLDDGAAALVSNEDLKGRELAALYDGLRQALDGLDGDLKEYAQDALHRAENYRSLLAYGEER